MRRIPSLLEVQNLGIGRGIWSFESDLYICNIPYRPIDLDDESHPNTVNSRALVSKNGSVPQQETIPPLAPLHQACRFSLSFAVSANRRFLGLMYGGLD